MIHDRKTADTVYRLNFGAFTYKAFQYLNPGQVLTPNWHIDTICYQLQRMVNGESQRQLVINLPPRSLKSLIASVCLPAWMLGRNPGARIICASYAEELALKFSRDCRTLMGTPFYKRVFSATRLNPRKITEVEFETTKRGYRLATSVGGTLTGRGGDALIIDDPIKANDAYSEVARNGADEWFRNTALSRLDKPGEGLMLLVMQRLHVDDLSGRLIERGWPSLAIPAMATEPASYLVCEDQHYHRPAGELLQPNRDSLEALMQLKAQHGSHTFAAQYQQNPTPPEGNMIKAAWLGRYDPVPDGSGFRRVVLACDPAGKPGADNDYTAITVVGIKDKMVYLLDVVRGHWNVLQMQEKILQLAAKWAPDLAIIEDTAAGMGLIPILREQSRLDVIGRTPKVDKETRMARQQGRFEAGRILLPCEAPWLAEFESELLAFPSARYDDQVDALLLLLDWYAENECNIDPVLVVPYVFRRDDPWPWPRETAPWYRNWSA